VVSTYSVNGPSEKKARMRHKQQESCRKKGALKLHRSSAFGQRSERSIERDLQRDRDPQRERGREKEREGGREGEKRESSPSLLHLKAPPADADQAQGENYSDSDTMRRRPCCQTKPWSER
jgi:hypothetical protein